MLLKIRPTVRLLMYMQFARLFDQAVSINVVCDGKQFGLTLLAWWSAPLFKINWLK